MQAAIGCAQLDKLDDIVAARRANYATLYNGLKDVPGLILPVAEENSNPSWFGFLIAVKEDAGFTRNQLTSYLEENKIQTRNLFAGNLIKHPAFDEMRRTGEGYRVVSELKNTDFIMNNGFWIGVYPGMTAEQNQFMIDTIKKFVKLTIVNRGG
jgi:CDP-6-deoxy-D-xylo-4-hexulose-3-dehydrase